MWIANSFLNQYFHFAIVLFYVRHFRKERKSDWKEKLDISGKKEEDPQWGRLAFVFCWMAFLKTSRIQYFSQNLVLSLAHLWEKQNKNSMHDIIHCKYSMPYKWKKIDHCRGYCLIVCFFLFSECHYSKIKFVYELTNL